ncbi:MAG: response regulator [Thermodesulfovibrionales bacterium]|nr:response regulator [Thermodesulfovibrionales bacterium]
MVEIFNKSEGSKLDVSILYVEDDAFIRKMLVSMLSNVVREIHTAENGLEGLKMFKNINPDIVLTDIRMPVMDGLEMASQIKSINKDSRIIVTTAYGDTENLLKAIDIGIDNYVLKPIDKNKLIKMLNRYADEIILTKRLTKQEHETASTKALLMAAIQQSPIGILVADAPAGTIKIANASALSIRGNTDCQLIDIDLYEQPKNWQFYHPDGELYKYYELPIAQTVMKGLTVKDVEIIVKRDNGETRWVLANCAPVFDAKNNMIASIMLLDDITEKKRLSDQLHHAQKMEAVGQLTGGLSHDFNNMLTAIMGYASLLRGNLEGDELNKNYVDQILSAAEKASTLTKSLLAFSRKQEISPRNIEINEILLSLQKLLTRLIGEDIELIIDCCDDELNVFADPIQFEQVIFNLATNARDAMPNGGQLKISTSISDGSDDLIYFNEEDPKKYALVKIADTGHGIDEKILDKIFEPFFTTKEKGKGTGLGLSMVYGIVKQHKGHIYVSSVVGKGTEFRIYLPITDVAQKIEDDKYDYTVKNLQGYGTILIAEDSDEVRAITKEILTSNGYLVIEAVDGQDAIEKFIENKDKIDVVILDIIMPKKSGKDAYDEIVKIKNDIKVIFVSGYTGEILERINLIRDKVRYIPKPISPQVLLHNIKEAIGN